MELEHFEKERELKEIITHLKGEKQRKSVSEVSVRRETVEDVKEEESFFTETPRIQVIHAPADDGWTSVKGMAPNKLAVPVDLRNVPTGVEDISKRFVAEEPQSSKNKKKRKKRRAAGENDTGTAFDESQSQIDLDASDMVSVSNRSQLGALDKSQLSFLEKSQIGLDMSALLVKPKVLEKPQKDWEKSQKDWEKSQKDSERREAELLHTIKQLKKDKEELVVELKAVQSELEQL